MPRASRDWTARQRSAGPLGAGAAVLVCGLTTGAGAEVLGTPGSVKLAPHRAIYEMKLGDARSGSGVTDLSGRMVFEISGSACEGYTQNMRFVMETTDRKSVV